MVSSLREVSASLETVSETRRQELRQTTGSFSLFEEKPLRELIDLAHEHGVYVSTVRLPRNSTS
jgi:hypothetical protein